MGVLESRRKRLSKLSPGVGGGIRKANKNVRVVGLGLIIFGIILALLSHHIYIRIRIRIRIRMVLVGGRYQINMKNNLTNKWKQKVRREQNGNTQIMEV